MSKQFQLYALPNDIERLIRELRRHLDIQLISPISNFPEQIRLESPIRPGSLFQKRGCYYVNCFMTRGDLADVQLRHVADDPSWRVDDASEVIGLSGFDFDGETLLRGRMCFQNDYLVGGQLLKKREVFLDWANEVFRLSKKHLLRSRTLNAYIGKDARSWALKGGRLASFAVIGGRTIYEHYSEK